MPLVVPESVPASVPAFVPPLSPAVSPDVVPPSFPPGPAIPPPVPPAVVPPPSPGMPQKPSPSSPALIHVKSICQDPRMTLSPFSLVTEQLVVILAVHAREQPSDVSPCVQSTAEQFSSSGSVQRQSALSA